MNVNVPHAAAGTSGLPRVRGGLSSRLGTGRRTAAAVCLMASDVAIVLAAGALAHWMSSGALFSGSVLLRLTALAAALQICIKAALGLYPGFGLHPEALLRKSSIAWTAAAALAVLADLLLAGSSFSAIAAFLLFFAAAGLAQGAGRAGVRALLRMAGFWGLPVRIVGNAAKVRELSAFLQRNGRYGLVPAPAKSAAPVALWAGSTLPDAPALRRLSRAYSEVVLVSDLPKTAFSGLQPGTHGGGLGLRLAGPGAGGALPLGKRLFDLAAALPMALIAGPVILLAGLAIRIADGGPVFYAQERIGLNGRKIRVLKLRTMYQDADRMLKELLASDADARAEWESHYKLRRDPRILPFAGRLLRATSMDELPQLFNVIRGDMSLVGPRPFPEYHLGAMTPAFRERRATVTPGLTGLWQISDRSAADIAQQEMLDGYYIDNRSFWLDLSILLRTFSAVIAGRGAY